jgi:hypothetical protein
MDGMTDPQSSGPFDDSPFGETSFPGDPTFPVWVATSDEGGRAEEESRDEGGEQQRGEPRQVLVVGPDGQPVGTAVLPGGEQDDDDGDQRDPAGLVEQPAKVMRIGSMIKQLLEEVRAAPLDEAGRRRLKEIHARSIKELEDGLAPELREELERLTLPFTDGDTPTEPELRIAQAQLVGWLEGLFHGIQAALVAQQMAARVQLEQMRRTPALPAGAGGLPPGLIPRPGEQAGGSDRTGQYL